MWEIIEMSTLAETLKIWDKIESRDLFLATQCMSPLSRLGMSTDAGLWDEMHSEVQDVSLNPLNVDILENKCDIEECVAVVKLVKDSSLATCFCFCLTESRSSSVTLLFGISFLLYKMTPLQLKVAHSYFNFQLIKPWWQWPNGFFTPILFIRCWNKIPF